MNRLQQTEPEIREDLQGRIEVFDQSIRSFEKRLRAVERRLSLETPPLQQPGIFFSGNFSNNHDEDNAGSIAAASSIPPQRSSIAPESSIPENSFLFVPVPLLSEESIPNCAFSAAVTSGEASNVSLISRDSPAEDSVAGYKVANISYLFSGLSESLRALQASLSELSNFVHNDLKSEIGRLDVEFEKLDNETKGLKDGEEKTNDHSKGLESRIETLENQNRLTFGSIRIPLEISG